MKVSTLTSSLLQQLQNYPLDQLEEKHEFSSWEYCLIEHTINELDVSGNMEPVNYGIDVEFLHTNGLDILLPVPIANHKNITINQSILSEDKQSVAFFLTDRTYYPDDDTSNRYLAVCKKIPECDGYVCCLYHSTYLQQLT